MKTISLRIFFVFSLLSLAMQQGCGSRGGESLGENLPNMQAECLKLDRGSCVVSQGPNDKCFFNNVSNRCESKLSLRAQDIVATPNNLVVLTKDGYLYRQDLGSSVLSEEKALSIAAAADFCQINEDNSLICEGSNFPPIPANTKAKHISLSGFQSSLCYIDMQDKVHCQAKNIESPNPQYGIQNISNNTYDYSNESFSNITVNARRACGRLKTSGEIVCFTYKNTLNNLDNFLIPVNNTALGFALTDRVLYYIDNEGKVRFNAIPGENGLRFDNFVAQDSKGPRLASSLISGYLNKDGSVSEILCFISNNKVYCSNLDPQENKLIDLSAFNPKNPVKITFSNNIICAIDADGAFQCANILGKTDDIRTTGFGPQSN